VTLPERPGAIEPVEKLLLTAVESCAIESLFTHVTVVPTETFSGFGENAVFVRVLAPLTIVTDAVVPVGVGAGVGDGDGAVYELPPQAERQSPARRMTPKRTAMLDRLLVRDEEAKTMPADLSIFGPFRIRKQ
jgi:hypothetical protein